MNKDKAEKKWYDENRWLPAVNAVRERRGYDRWGCRTTFLLLDILRRWVGF